MNRKIVFVSAVVIGFLGIECTSNNPSNQSSTSQPTTEKKDSGVLSSGKGIGKYTNVELTHPLDQAMVGKGKAIFDSKCSACHKLTDEKLVGPGWKGVTDRRQPEWIMNFVTNTSVMLDKDLAAQKELVTCVVRMPDQSLSDD